MVFAGRGFSWSSASRQQELEQGPAPGLGFSKLSGATKPGVAAEPCTSKTNPCISFSMLLFSPP